MIYIIILCIVILFLILSYLLVKDHNKGENVLSFAQGFDLTNLPIVTVFNGKNKLNFLLDTGSDESFIRSSMADKIEGIIEKADINVTGLGGQCSVSKCIVCSISYKENNYEVKLHISEPLEKAFDHVKEHTGVKLHGILGTSFFAKYRYLINFDNFTAYSK